MSLKSKKQIALVKTSAQILSEVHGEVAKAITPGITTEELDNIAEEYIRKANAVPSFKGYNGFPNTLCISVNENVLHGLPGKYVLKEGDIISIDCGVCYQGFHADAAFTHPVGNVKKELLNLLAVTEQALYKGIVKAKVGNTVGDIGYAIQQHVERNGYNVVREYSGHGLGKVLHEEPWVRNYGERGKGARIKEGMVLAIEPIVNLGGGSVYSADRWTVVTKDHSPSAHFEHTIAIVCGEPTILTTFEYIKRTK